MFDIEGIVIINNHEYIIHEDLMIYQTVSGNFSVEYSIPANVVGFKLL